jgi:hypothetical protein
MRTPWYSVHGVKGVGKWPIGSQPAYPLKRETQVRFLAAMP